MEITQEFKLIDKIEPPVKNGRRTFSVVQTVTPQGEQPAEYTASQEYVISHNAFTLGADEVFSVYPANGEAGDFGRTLPYITLNERTLPWAFGSSPFLALLVLKSSEIIGQGEIEIKELFTPTSGTYFPKKPEFPEIYSEDDTEHCRFIDISRRTYSDIFPSSSDISLLAHVKFLNLSRAQDKVCGKDGYFSVILANRFVPSDSEGETFSECHLVTVFGHGKGVPDDCEKVRLVSLYSWNIRSRSEKGRPFTELVKGLSKNCKEIGGDRTGGEAVLMPHYTRTGEMTYSLYRSPFAAGECEEIPQLSRAHTADGRLIYDKKIGIFDVSYAAAFQLGRLITLGRPEMAEKVLSHRNDSKAAAHKEVTDRIVSDTNESLDFDALADLLISYTES